MLYLGILLTILFLGTSALFVRLRQALPTKRSTESTLKRCTNAIANRQWEQALSLITPLSRCKLGGSEALRLHAHILRAIHMPQEALKIAKKGLRSDPKNLGLLLEKGKALLDLGDSQQALDALGQSEAIFQEEEDYLDLACTLFQTGHLEEALEKIDTYLSTSQSGRLFALAGDIHFAKQEYAPAVRCYLKARHHGWRSQQVTTRLGYGLLGAHHLETAAHYFKEILEKEENDIAATLGLGRTYEIVGEIDKALEIYQNGPAWDLGDPHLLRQAGFCAIETRRYEHAEMYLSAAKERGCLSPKLLAFLAYSQECLGNNEQAEATFKELTQHFSDHPAGYRGLAWLCGTGKSTLLTPAEGVAMAYKAVDLLPDHASWELLSACEARAGNFDTAHHIQERLEAHEKDRDDRQRHRSAMRLLRKRQPLEAHLMRRSLVA